MLPGVSKTALLTLRARADEHARSDSLLDDPIAAQWFGKVDWPPELDAWYSPQVQSHVAMRADDFDRLIRKYCEIRPASELSVTELGCGLTTRRHRMADVSFRRWLDLDLEPVVELRKQWGADGDHLAYSVLDHGWMDSMEGPPDAHVFIAEGLLYYLPRAEVDALFAELRRRFAGSVVIQDCVGANDFDKLLENTSSAGTPAQWGFENGLASAFEEIGLEVVDGFDPDTTTDEAVARYWSRFDGKLKFGIQWARGVPSFWAKRSANLLGRLKPS